MIHEPVTKAAAGQCVCSLAVTGHRICSAHEQTWWEHDGVTTESVLCGTCGHDMDCHGSDDDDYCLELYCGDEMVASAWGPRDAAEAEISHYAMQYGEDGPLEIMRVTRTPYVMGGEQ